MPYVNIVSGVGSGEEKRRRGEEEKESYKPDWIPACQPVDLCEMERVSDRFRRGPGLHCTLQNLLYPGPSWLSTPQRSPFNFVHAPISSNLTTILVDFVRT